MGKSLDKLNKRFKGERTLGTIIVVIFMLVFWVLMYTPYRVVFTCCVSLIAALATYEVEKCIGCKNKVVYVLSMAYSVLETFLISYKVGAKWNIILTVYILLMLIITVSMHEKTKFTDTACAILTSVAYTYSFSCLILIRDYYLINTDYSKQDCYWLFLFSFGCSWLTDACAFLTGRKFGKHKLCPKISPKKSVEGAIGGVVFTAIAADLVYFLYNIVINRIYGIETFGTGFRKYIVFIGLTVVLSVISMFGDLSASVLKRNYGVKDYSNLIPGHGGIMDRFDSSIFVLPVLYAFISGINLFY